MNKTEIELRKEIQALNHLISRQKDQILALNADKYKYKTAFEFTLKLVPTDKEFKIQEFVKNGTKIL